MLKDLKDRAAAIACDFSADDVEIGTAVREIMRLVQDAVDAERKDRESKRPLTITEVREWP